VQQLDKAGSRGPRCFKHLASSQAADGVVWPQGAGCGQDMGLIVVIVGPYPAQVTVLELGKCGRRRARGTQHVPGGGP
jgi:hypothetical protein